MEVDDIDHGGGGAGWYGILAILQLQRDTVKQYRQQQPAACPHDGTPLRSGPNGELYCPFDGWQWDGSPEDAYPPVR